MSNEREAFESWWTNDAEGTDNKEAAFEGWKARAEWQRSQEQEELAELQVLLRKIWPLINGAKDAVHDEIKAAPSHGGGVAHTDCRSEDGITVGLIDSIITSCRVLSSRDLTCEAAVEALRDLRSDSDVSLIKPSHGEQVREGWQLVPVEPTDAMKLAGNDALAQHWGAGDAYRAMLAASRLPVQPVQGMSNRSADRIAVPSAPAQDGWIPVSERLPEIATDVLVYGVNHGSASYTVAGLFSGSWESQETEETTRFEPTHWMPLPSVPKGGE